MGKYFVTLAREIGYERTILQLGRRMRDFFLNLDNLHDYLKYTFPKMKAPSFFIEDEDEGKMLLQYRTRRRGFHFYVQGQVRLIYNQSRVDSINDKTVPCKENCKTIFLLTSYHP